MVNEVMLSHGSQKSAVEEDERYAGILTHLFQYSKVLPCYILVDRFDSLKDGNELILVYSFVCIYLQFHICLILLRFSSLHS